MAGNTTFAEQGIKVRTISCFVTLGPDSSTWPSVLEPAASFSASLSKTYEERGYEVQSLRLILNPFGEYVDTSSEASALQSVACPTQSPEYQNSRPVHQLRVALQVSAVWCSARVSSPGCLRTQVGAATRA